MGRTWLPRPILDVDRDMQIPKETAFENLAIVHLRLRSPEVEKAPCRFVQSKLLIQDIFRALNE
jgi:hypothetical protein